MRTRPTIRRPALALGLLACTLPAWGQAAAAPAAARADAAEAAAAMERAQRLANNPLRMILEASRVRRKADAEAAPEAADASVLRRTAARAEGAAPTAPVPPAAATAGAAPPPDSAPPAMLVTLAADATLAQPLATEAPALKAEHALQPMLAVEQAPGPLPSPEMAALLVQPRLLAMKPPAFAPRVLDQVGRVGEVAVELTIRADGSVAEVTVLPPAPRALHRGIVDALMQWRYEPLPAERKHRVELVFGREG